MSSVTKKNLKHGHSGFRLDVLNKVLCLEKREVPAEKQIQKYFFTRTFEVGVRFSGKADVSESRLW